MKRLRRKMNQKGFSLAEMLMAILILLMVSVIVATGMPAARNAYEKVVVGANAQTMLSTAVTVLRDELGTAWEVNVPSTNDSVSYFNANTGAKAQIKLDDSNTIIIQDYIAQTTDLIHDNVEALKEGAKRTLVPGGSSKLYATYATITPLIVNNKMTKITIGNLAIYQKDTDSDKPVASLANLEIRLLSQPPITTG